MTLMSWLWELECWEKELHLTLWTLSYRLSFQTLETTQKEFNSFAISINILIFPAVPDFV